MRGLCRAEELAAQPNSMWKGPVLPPLRLGLKVSEHDVGNADPAGRSGHAAASRSQRSRLGGSAGARGALNCSKQMPLRHGVAPRTVPCSNYGCKSLGKSATILDITMRRLVRTQSRFLTSEC